MMQVRLQKVLADAGVASRRTAERLMVEGRVTVNGRVVTQLGAKADPDRDRIEVDGQTVRAKRKLYIALNKPRGYLCSRNDPQQRRTVYELLPPEWHNLFTVGRLDRDTEGLLLLTNDGSFSLQLAHPRFGVRKTYIATVPGRISPSVLTRMVRGVFHEGEKLRADRARVLKAGASHSLVELELTEGKNREIRRLFETQGVAIDHLKRVQIGSLKLGELKLGRWRALTEPEIASLLPLKEKAARSEHHRHRL